VRSRTETVVVRPPERNGFVDLTEELFRAVKDAGVTDGCAVVFCAHTTAALLINEWEDGALEDFRARLEALVPAEVAYDLTRRTQNLEDTHERPNGRSHVGQMLLGQTSHAIPVVQGEPMLGRWQRLMLLELDEPKAAGRNVVFHVFGE